MSSIIDALYEIKYNPFQYGPYLASFYTSLEESENNLLLAQLVIPLCSHPIFSHKLLKSNKISSIWSVFGGKTKLYDPQKGIDNKTKIKNPQEHIDDKTKLYDLQERIDGFQALTEQCIQYCLVNDWLSVNEQRLSLTKCDCDEVYSNFINQKSAEKLGRLFSGHSVVEIYAFLGVKPR